MKKMDWKEVKQRMQNSWNQMKIFDILSNMSKSEFDRVVYVVKNKPHGAHTKISIK